MTGTELKMIIAEKGFHPISVSMPNDDLDRTPRFEGTIDEFWVAMKALGAKVVFLLEMQMNESDYVRNIPSDDLIRNNEDDEDDSFNGENYTIKLEEILPTISKFRRHVDKDCAFVLIAKGGIAEMDFLITEEWWDEFQEEAEKAVEIWTECHNEQAEKVEAKVEKRNAELLVKLKALINDREFCLLKTQRAKFVYALEKIPDLEELSEHTLKPEIQTLHARIEAKGLNRKVRG